MPEEKSSSVKVLAKLGKITSGWHGKHAREVAQLEIQGKDSPFDAGASIIVDAAPLKGLPEGQWLELSITPIDPPAATAAKK